MKIKIHNSITEINEKDWDSIVSHDRIICKHQYLEAIENSGINNGRYYYPVVYDNNRIIAHTCLYTISTELDLFAQGPLKKMIDGLRKVWKNFLVLRSLECGTPVALGNTISFRDGTNRLEILELLCRKTEQLAKELHIGTILFRDFYGEEAVSLFDSLVRRGYSRIHNLPNTTIEIRWKTFADYLDSMRSHYKWKIIKRMRKFSEGGLTIHVLEDFSEYVDQMEQLWININENAKEYSREKLRAPFFKNINKYLGSRSGAILVMKNAIPIGFTALLFDDETLIPIYSGLDYKYNMEYCVYFNLLYKIVEIGINRGMKNIHMGLTTIIPKKDLGAEVVPLFMYMKHLNPLLNQVLPKAFDGMTPQDETGPRRVFKKNGQKCDEDAKHHDSVQTPPKKIIIEVK